MKLSACLFLNLATASKEELMRDELELVMSEVRRNEAIIEYLELKGVLPEPMRSLGDVVQNILADIGVKGEAYDHTLSR